MVHLPFNKGWDRGSHIMTPPEIRRQKFENLRGTVNKPSVTQWAQHSATKHFIWCFKILYLTKRKSRPIPSLRNVKNMSNYALHISTTKNVN